MARNVYSSERDTLFIDVVGSGVITASLASQERLEPHNWRIVSGEVVTTVPGPNGYEVKTWAGNVILGKHRSVSVAHKNGNPLDCRLRNLRVHRTAGSNRIRYRGDIAYLDIVGRKKKTTVTLDAADGAFVELYHWTANNRRIIRYRTDRPTKTRYTQSLAAYLLGAHGHCTVQFLNGDHNDYRRLNLQLRTKEVHGS